MKSSKPSQPKRSRSSEIDETPFTWVERIIGFASGLIVGPIIGLALGLLLLFLGQSMWSLLIMPLTGLIVGPPLGAIFPGTTLSILEHFEFLSPD